MKNRSTRKKEGKKNGKKKKKKRRVSLNRVVYKLAYTHSVYGYKEFPLYIKRIVHVNYTVIKLNLILLYTIPLIIISEHPIKQRNE